MTLANSQEVPETCQSCMREIRSESTQSNFEMTAAPADTFVVALLETLYQNAPS